MLYILSMRKARASKPEKPEPSGDSERVRTTITVEGPVLDWAKTRAKKQNLRGGVSELLEELIKEEAKRLGRPLEAAA
jgi:hypothetical protein